jgi:hypothetical protein
MVMTLLFPHTHKLYLMTTALHHDTTTTPELASGVSDPRRAAEIARREVQQLLQRHSAYDVLPVSFRLIMLDTDGVVILL